MWENCHDFDPEAEEKLKRNSPEISDSSTIADLHARLTAAEDKYLSLVALQLRETERADTAEGEVADLRRRLAEAEAQLSEQRALLRQALEALLTARDHVQHQEDVTDGCYDWCPLCQITVAMVALSPGRSQMHLIEPDKC